MHIPQPRFDVWTIEVRGPWAQLLTMAQPLTMTQPLAMTQRLTMTLAGRTGSGLRLVGTHWLGFSAGFSVSSAVEPEAAGADHLATR